MWVKRRMRPVREITHIHSEKSTLFRIEGCWRAGRVNAVYFVPVLCDATQHCGAWVCASWLRGRFEKIQGEEQDQATGSDPVKRASGIRVR